MHADLSARRRLRLPRIATGRRVARVAFPIIALAVLAAIVIVRKDAFVAAITAAPAWLLISAILLQLVALLARCEAWALCVQATGSSVTRRPVFHASGIGGLVGILNGPSGVVARLATLRRSAPKDCPALPSLITSEVPILAIEVTLAALTSFTLLGPLGLPWWVPVLCGVAAATGVAALSRLARRRTSGLWSGLAILRSVNGRGLVIALVLVAVLAQIARNWLALHAIGVDASLFDAIAVLIAMVVLSQLPIGPSVGAAAVVLILGTNGVALAAAAGVLLSATGAAGTLAFGGWALADRIRPRAVAIA